MIALLSVVFVLVFEQVDIAPVVVKEENPVALGAFVGGAPDAGKLGYFTSVVERKPSFVTWYQDWVGTTGFVREHFEAADAKGATPMLTWTPENRSLYGNSVYQPEYTLRTVTAGNYDAYIRQTARDMKAWGKPVYLRFAHEMNGDWYPWGNGVNGNGPAEYVQAWRHVHGIFEQEGAANVRWVWSPSIKEGANRPGMVNPSYSSLYPGDAYVDWVALDGYNWGRSEWQSFRQVFDSSYHEVTSLTDKPMMIAETASAEQGGDKAAWIRQGMFEDIPKRFPRVRAVLWFNIDKERDWRVDSSPTSLAAYKEIVASPLYQARLP